MTNSPSFSFSRPEVTLCGSQNVKVQLLARVSGRVVVVVVRELFSLVTSAICVRIRGQRSEVTKIVYHMTQVFRLLLRSHHTEFVGTI